jgi:hypothetical protein
MFQHSAQKQRPGGKNRAFVMTDRANCNIQTGRTVPNRTVLPEGDSDRAYGLR